MDVAPLVRSLGRIPASKRYGQVKSIQGLTVVATHNLKGIGYGTLCEVMVGEGGTVLGEVVGFDDNLAYIMPFSHLEQIHAGHRVSFFSQPSVIYPHASWKGRILNGLGQPIDGGEYLKQGENMIPVRQMPPNAHARHKVHERLDVGVKALNTFLTCCKGQRLGIFAGSGVGKSMLLSMLARYTECDVCIIGLVGERGREVREFIEDTLGEEGLAKSIMVVATSDESPLMRRQAAYTTLAVAEYFRDQGQSVLCLLDSVTRFAMAQREIGLSVGEPPTTKGYTPSVFTELAKLMERAGPGIKEGDITAFFTVLVDGDDHNEPIADAVRGILDGHIVLERGIAERNHFPAINILRSISRTVPRCHEPDEHQAVALARRYLSAYEDMADMIRLGAYKKGSNAEVDQAIEFQPKLMQFLKQNHAERVSLPEAFIALKKIMEGASEAS